MHSYYFAVITCCRTTSEPDGEANSFVFSFVEKAWVSLCSPSRITVI